MDIREKLRRMDSKTTQVAERVAQVEKNSDRLAHLETLVAALVADVAAHVADKKGHH